MFSFVPIIITIVIIKLNAADHLHKTVLNASMFFLEQRDIRSVELIIVNSSKGSERNSSVELVGKLFFEISRQSTSSCRIRYLAADSTYNLQMFENIYEKDDYKYEMNTLHFAVIWLLQDFERIKEILYKYQKQRWLVLVKFPFEQIKNKFEWRLDNLLTFMELGISIKFIEAYKVTSELPTHTVTVGIYNSHLMKYYLEVEEPWARRNNFTGMNIRIGILDNLMFTKRNFTAHTNKDLFSGVTIDLLDNLQNSLNFTYFYFEPNDRTFGTLLINGSWTGMVGQLVNNEVDISISDLTVNSQRAKDVDFLIPYQYYKYQLTMVKPDLRSNIWSNFTRIFTPLAWITLVIYLLLFCMTFRWFSHVSPLSECVNYGDSFFIVITTLLTQACPVKVIGTANRVMYISWLSLGYLTFVYYKSFLISSLTVVIIRLPFSDLYELYEERNHYKLSILQQSSIDHYFESSLDPLKYSIFQDMVKPFPEIQKNNYREIEQIMLKDKKILTIFDEFQLITMKDRCNYSSLQTAIMAQPVSWGLQKNSSLRQIFDHHIQKMVEGGTYIKLLKSHLYPYELKNCNDLPWQSIELLTAITAPVVFLLIVSLSVVILICEKNYKQLL